MEYIYNGMPESEQSIWLEAMRKNIDVPKTKDFRIRDKDKGAVLLHKQAKQKEYREMREAELQDELKQHSRYRTICGMTFTKGVPLDVTAQVDEDGLPLELTKEELSKLHGLVKLGVLSMPVGDKPSIVATVGMEMAHTVDASGESSKPRRGRPPKNAEA